MTYIAAQRLRQGKKEENTTALRQWNFDVFEYFEQEKAKAREERTKSAKKEDSDKTSE